MADGVPVMSKISVHLEGEEREIAYDRVLLAGYSGRDQGGVQAHIAELRKHGIPAPDRTPALFMCSPHLLTTAAEITVFGENTSGEAEFVLLLGGGEMWVAAGSDHTDRALEATDIPRAKQVCQKVLSREVWRYQDVQDHWDELSLRAWVGDDGPEVLYQEERLESLMTPPSLIEYARGRVVGDLGHAVLFSGTVPILGGQFQSRPFFAVQLEDPRRRRKLQLGYRVSRLDYVR